MTHTPTRRLLALLLAVATVFSLLSVSVSAAELEPFRVRFTGAVLFLDYVHTAFEQVFGEDIQK